MPRRIHLSVCTALVALLSGCPRPQAKPDSGFPFFPVTPGGPTDGAVGSPDASTTDCTTSRDFTACSTDASVAMCFGGACVALTACDAGGCGGSGPTFPIPDTSLRVCYGPSPNHTDGTIACPGTAAGPACGATDYCGEDAQYGWDTVHDRSQRFAVSSSVPAEPVVTDTVTSLGWQGCSAGQSGAACSGQAALMNWFDAVSYCEGAGWGGYTDWRLPDSFELQSIVDFSVTSPAIDQAVFVNTPSRFQTDYDQWWIECVWSSSTYIRDSTVAWVLMSNSGDISEGSGTTYHLNDKAAATWPGCYARCVRGGTAPATSRFVRAERVAQEPIVADTVTRLVWQGCSAGQSGTQCSGTAAMIDWKSSLAYCEGLSWGGHDDWRLPNIKELRSIVDLDRSYPAIDPTAFPNTPCYGPALTDQNAGQYWSSTARSYNDFALYAEFGTGFTHFYIQPEGRHARCVRDP